MTEYCPGSGRSPKETDRVGRFGTCPVCHLWYGIFPSTGTMYKHTRKAPAKIKTYNHEEGTYETKVTQLASGEYIATCTACNWHAKESSFFNILVACQYH